MTSMAVQIASGAGGLVSLGLSVGDIVAVVSYGRRIGNWWTAKDGDSEMLSFLGEDGSNILKRRGIIDVLGFNKRWRKQIQLLANGEPARLEEAEIKKVMSDPQDLLHVCFSRSCIPWFAGAIITADLP